MFNKALYEENETFILQTLQDLNMDTTMLEHRTNYPLVIYHLTNLTKDRYQFGEKFYATAILTIAQALSANSSSYESIGVYYEALHLPYFRRELKYRFAIYMQLLDLSIRKKDFFFIELFMYKLRKYQFTIEHDEEYKLLFDLLCLRIEILNNPEFNTSQLKIINDLLARTEQTLSLTSIEVSMYLEDLLGDCLFNSSDYEDSLQYHSQAFAKAKTLKELYSIAEIALKLSKTYEKMNNKVLALDLYKKHYNALQFATKVNRLNIEDYMLEIHGLPHDPQNASMMMIKNSHLDSFSVLDRLTNTNVQTFFESQLALLAHAPTAAHDHVAIIFIDIDWFKNYNTHYGHIKGDQVLSEIGFTLRNSIDLQNSILARISGDQFAILLKEVPKEDAVINGKQILANVRKLDIEHRVNKNINILTVSIGVSVGKASHLPQIYESAKIGMKNAKTGGKNRVVYHSEKGSTK